MTITSPTSGASVAGTITVSASVSIVGSAIVAGVQFKLGGANLGAEDTTAPYSVPWNTTTTNNGSHTLTAVARDALGLQYTSDPVTVTVSNDTTPPTVSITSPTAGATVAGRITVSAAASDNVGVAGVQFKLDGNNLGAEVTTAPYAVSWDTTGVANGSHTLTAVARDAAGNRTTSAPVTVTVSNDTTPPTVTITSPTAGATVAGTVTVSATASDNVGVAGVQFMLDGAALGAEDTAAPYSIAWDTTSTSNGSHTLTAVARDAAGNRGTSAPVTVTVSNDTTPPTVTITSPTAGATFSGTLTVSAAASDNVGVAGVQFKLDGANLGAEVSTAPYAVSWNTTTAANGAHTLTAVARDAAGNTATSAAVSVTVANDTTPPTVTITSPTAGATVAATVTVSASASDNVGVAGVQFKLDGANLGAEDTTVPYSIAWDTTSTTNGSHTLTALARDAAGNRTTSDPVTVTVSNDTTPPTVTITAPTSGATVSGTLTVSATASDNVGVAGVQFKQDGANLGAEDTTAPYSIAWDTTTTTNGSHTLTVVARDAAGNRGTSAPVTITVSNTPPGTVTRFEETDPSLVYTAGWLIGSTDREWNCGTAADSTTTGAQATFTFTGTAVNWIGFRGPQAGIARVSLDGAFVAEVDTYSATEQIQAVVFTATGLAAASHTLTIEVTGLKNPASTGVVIVVDAFDVTSPAPPLRMGTRFEDADPSITYTAGWSQGSTSKPWSAGTAAFSTTAGAQATFTFLGTSVSWIGFRGPQAGIARVSLDGAFVAQVDTYSATEEVRAVVFAATGLAAASHTLTIEVTGLKNLASTDVTIVLDAFDVTSTRFEEADPSVAYTAGWLLGNRSRPWSCGTAAVSTTTGAQATFTFTGTAVSWIGFRGPQAGIARVSLDGAFVAEVDTYSATEKLRAVVFTATGLAAGSHTLTIEVTGLKNAASTDVIIVVDAFDVTA